MKLRYRDVDYETIHSIQPTKITPGMLAYCGNLYQSNQHQRVTQKIENQQFIVNRSPQNSLQKTTIASLQLMCRGVAYTL